MHEFLMHPFQHCSTQKLAARRFLRCDAPLLRWLLRNYSPRPKIVHILLIFTSMYYIRKHLDIEGASKIQIEGRHPER